MALFLRECERQPLISLEDALQPLLTIVPDLEHMFQSVQTLYEQDKDDPLPFNESATIRLYTFQARSNQPSFRFLFDRILSLQDNQKLLVLPWLPYLRLFLHALSNLPSISPSPIYRKSKLNPGEAYTIDHDISWSTFVLCSSSRTFFDDEYIDDNHPVVMFSIKCHSAKDISRYSQGRNADRFLLCPDQVFRIKESLTNDHHLKSVTLEELPEHRRNFNGHLFSEEHIQMTIKHELNQKKSSALVLSRTAMIADDVPFLAKELQTNKTLKFLSLAYNYLSDQGIQSLMEILTENHSKIKILSLHATGLTDRSVRLIANMLKKNTSLAWLHLGRNKIGDRSIQHLINVLTHHNQTLEALDLSHNRLITDSSIDAIIEMVQTNHTLETLWIRQCSISEHAQTRLKKAVHATRRFFVLSV